MILTMVKSVLSKPPADCLHDGAEMCGRLTTTQQIILYVTTIKRIIQTVAICLIKGNTTDFIKNISFTENKLVRVLIWSLQNHL